MSKFYLDILFALSISIAANILTPYLQNLLHVHAINAAHKKNRRIAALNRLAQMPARGFSDVSALGSARESINGSLDGSMDGSMDGLSDRLSDRTIAVPIEWSNDGLIHGPLGRSAKHASHPVLVKKYRIEGFVLATGALIWSLLRSGPVAMAISLVAMVITGIRIKKSSKFINPISPSAPARSLEYQEMS